jgi:ribosomal protein L11 methyltransferase
MKYFEVTFHISAPQAIVADVADVLAAMAGETGFESFEEASTGLRGYIQEQLFDRDAIEALAASLPFDGVSVSYDVRPADYADWNAPWEQAGFEPITIGKELVIHDGVHRPTAPDGSDARIEVEIDSKMAFGTGNHVTTRMMCCALLDTQLQGCRILDCGTGTGILAILALKRGAEEAVAYDIDEWSAMNAMHNAVINGVEHRISVMQGDSRVIAQLKGWFDVVTANINRNILLDDMEAMASRLKTGGTLLLSGFYQDDAHLLTDRALTLGLTCTAQMNDGEWAALSLLKS